MKRIIINSALLIAAHLTVSSQIVMNIDATRRGPETSPYQYGLFFEEINHAGDGGLYAELVRNRSFEESLDGWSSVGNANLTTVTSSLLNDAQKKAVCINTTGASQTNLKGIANEGFWGMGIVKDSTYTFSFYAKGSNNFTGKIYVRLMSNDGKSVIGEATTEGTVSQDKWTRQTATIKATASDKQAHLQLVTSYGGYLYADMVSLFPYTWNNRKNGLRPDLAQLLADTKPTFLRFPGGCYVEGEGSYDNTFQWKKTIGPIEERPGHMNQNWRYYSSDGLGFDEYLQLCEDLNAAPLYVVNVGLGHGFTFSLEETKVLVQDALDAIEYANGDATTEWGAKRIANGHPEPYNLKFIEIGNENYQADAGSADYPERYYMFYKAIKEKYPDIITIGNVEAWGTDNPTWRNEYPVELVDEHYYRSHSWMRQNYNKYDGYPRNIGIYNGEYAANAGGTYGVYGNMNSALGEAVYMLGMERNSDVCRMASFAPIFVHEKDPRWPYDMIHFNAGGNFVTPSYYVQQMLGGHLGKQNLLWTESGNTFTQEVSNVKVGLGTWNTMVTFDDAVLTDLSGNVIVSEDFSTGMSSWVTGNGSWAVSDEALGQTALAENCTAVLNMPVSGDGYVYKVRARKDGGDEGFLIMFNSKDNDNYIWWNIGGWNNTQHGVEVCVNGGKTTVASVGGRIETGRWYDIEVRVDNGKITCLLDGNTVHEFTLSQDRAIYQSVQIDEETGELIVKVVNPNDRAQTLCLNVQNMKLGGGKVYRLASANGTDENTMDDPFYVKPTEENVSEAELSALDIPAYSLNIYRLKATEIGKEVKTVYEAYEKEDADKYGYLYAHMHTTQEITCFALSQNANYWRDLFNSTEVFDTKKYTSTGGMRDAFVYRTQNGKFMLAGTDMTSRLGWTSNHKMTFMLSNDLVHWDKSISIDLETPENLKALGLSNADQMTAAWAPQIIFDPVTEKYVLYYSVGFPDRHRIYYSLINEDLTGLTLPKVFYDPGFDVIDADIVWNDVDKQYMMIFKREGNRALSMATAKYIVPSGDKTTGSCQWELVDGFGIDEPGQSIEAPSLFRYIGNTTWKLGYQKYSNGYNYRLMDLDEHGHNPKNRMDIQGSLAAQHGSFLKLTEREYRHLETWEKVVTDLAEVKKLQEVVQNAEMAEAIAKAEAALNTNGATFEINEQAMKEAAEALTRAKDQADSDYKQAIIDKAERGEKVDLTLLIENADFSKGSTGWTNSPAFTAANGYVAEYWNTNFRFSQIVEGLPKGDYEITVQSFFRNGDIGTALDSHNNGTEKLSAMLFANDIAVPVMSIYDNSVTRYSQDPYTYPDNVTAANEAFNDYGLYVNSLKFTLKEKSDVVLGIYKDEYVYSDWCCFDNFTLNYLGIDTGIGEVAMSMQKSTDGRCYNLNGQQVSYDMVKSGLVIKNGRIMFK